MVDLSVDGAGAVAVAGVHGLDGEIAACITTAAAGAAPPGASPGAYRCAFAHGTLAAADAPGIDLTGANVVLDDTLIASVGRIVEDPEPRATVPDLAERLAASPAVGDAVIAVDGPLVVRVSDDAPMVAVDRVLATAGAADRGAVLAAHRDGAWTVLRGLALPLAPVAGTDGGRWFDGKPLARDPDPDGEEQVVASIAEAKQSMFLEDRVDLEIGADPEIQFGDVVKAIELAAAAGFSEWRVVAPAALAGRPPR